MEFWTGKAFALLIMLEFNGKSVLAFEKEKEYGGHKLRPLQLHNGFIK